VRHRFYANTLYTFLFLTLKTTTMANDQRDMNSGNMGQGRSGMGNQDADSSMGSHPGMGNADSGMGSGKQRGSEGLGDQSQGTSGNMGQGGLGSDMDDMELDSGDAGRGGSTGTGRTGTTDSDSGTDRSRSGDAAM
jgi:hypothetical protein